MQVFVVGGFVRDTLLGLSPKDVDFVVTGATPQDMLNRGFSQVGADFPVFLDKEGREWALARKERKVGDGYHGFECDFDPTVTLEEDLFRRDLTINAMAMPVLKFLDGGQITFDSHNIVDPFNGQSDLEAKILRHVSDHFAEDPVRVLRVARFSARYGFAVHPATLELIDKMSQDGELDHLVPERVWAELDKAIMEPHVHRFFHVLQATPALNAVFPELECVLQFWNLVNGNTARDRFALLAVKMGSSAALAMFRRLKAPTELIDFIRKFTSLVSWMGDSVTSGRKFTAEEMLWLLKTHDCFRDKNFMLHAAWAAETLDQEIFERIGTVLAGQMAADNVGFDDLTDDQKNTLKGKDIGEAIDELRLEAIRQQVEGLPKPLDCLSLLY